MIDIYVGSNRFYQISTLPGVFLNFLKFDVHKSCRLLEKDVKLKRYSKLVKTQKMCPFISPYYQRSFASISSVVQVWAAKVIYSYRGNRPKVFCKKGVLENFAKFTGKHLCWSLKKLRYMVTDVFLWILRTPIFRIPANGWLLLSFNSYLKISWQLVGFSHSKRFWDILKQRCGEFFKKLFLFSFKHFSNCF